MEWLAKVFEFLKLPTKIIAFFAFISGLLLFIPEKIVKTLRLTDFINEFGKYFGIAFLISSIYLLFIFIPYFIKLLSAKYKNHKANKSFINSIEETLNGLSYPEKCLLREFVLQNKNVIEAPIENTEVVSLLNKGIIQYASNNVRSFIFGHFACIQINEKAKKYFTNDTYGLPNKEPTEADRRKVIQERPDFLTRLEYVNNLMNGLR